MGRTDAIKNGSVDAAGYMTKRGKIVHSWKRRFFILSGAQFSYFADSTLNLQLGGGVCARVSRWPERRHGLLLTTDTGRTFQLICESLYDLEFWLQHFTRAIVAQLRSAFVHLKLDDFVRDSMRESSKSEMLKMLRTPSASGLTMADVVNRCTAPAGSISPADMVTRCATSMRSTSAVIDDSDGMCLYKARI